MMNEEYDTNSQPGGFGDGPDGSSDEHARLCAYLLNELPPADHADVARSIANDPDLSALADELRATLQMVDQAFPIHAEDPEEFALSADRRAALIDAAKPTGNIVRSFRWAPGLAAAAIAVAAAGLYGFHGMSAGDHGKSGTRRFATQSEPSATPTVASAPSGQPVSDSESDVGIRLLPRSGSADQAGEAGLSGVPGIKVNAPNSLTLWHADMNRQAAGSGTSSLGEANTDPLAASMEELAQRSSGAIEEFQVVQDQFGTDSSEIAAVEAAVLLQDAGSTVNLPFIGHATTQTKDASRLAGFVAGKPEATQPGSKQPESRQLGIGSASATFEASRGLVAGGAVAVPSPDPNATLGTLSSASPMTYGTPFQPPVLGRVAVMGTPVATPANGTVRYLAGVPGTVVGNTATNVAFGEDPQVVASTGYAISADFDVEIAQGAVFDFPVIPLTPEALLEQCRRQPNETPAMMFFRFWGDNPFVRTARDPLSTFSADVDTASYTLARRYLNSGLIPDKAAIRTEEFLNYFSADIPAPEGETFRIHLEGAKSLFGGPANDRYLLRVTVRGKDVAAEDRAAHRLTFVVDTSGSMKEENRMELVKHGLRLLVGELSEPDEISIVAFNSSAQLILPMTSIAHRGVIEAAIHGLTPDGNTNAEAGLKLGYEVAATALNPEATSRVILLSDGVANVGQTDQDRINIDVKSRREQGIYLNTIGVGLGNHNDVFLEQLADQGDGVCNYIDSEKEAQRALVENFTGALITIARDVKVQVEFDPSIIGSYRQIGYENRAVADQDFRNDQVDAGEVGAGHQVTALYEVEPLVDLRASSKPLATVRVRYKPPFEGNLHGADAGPNDSDGVDTTGILPPSEVVGAESEEGAALESAPMSATPPTEVTEIEATWTADQLSLDFAQASAGYRRATLVAEFAELLRRSTHASDGSLDQLYHEATLLEPELDDPDFTEFCELLKASRSLVVAHLGEDDPLSQAVDAVRRNAVLRAELEDLAGERDKALLEEVERENRKLEERIRELLGDRIGKNGGEDEGR